MVLGGLENRGLVHVVPDTVHIVGSLEDRWVEEIFPVVTSAVVKEVNPDGFAGSALSLICLLGCGVSDEEARNVVFIHHLSLLLKTLFVHEVVLGGADMRISSDHKSTARVMHSFVHVHDIVLREANVVELTILIILSIFTVEPEDIDRESEFTEVIVPLNNLVRRVVFPLREVVSKRVHGRHWSVSSQLTKLLLELLGVALSTQKVELKSIALGDEGRVCLLTAVCVIKEDKCLSRVHPCNGGICGMRVAHNVRN